MTHSLNRWRWGLMLLLTLQGWGVAYAFRAEDSNTNDARRALGKDVVVHTLTADQRTASEAADMAGIKVKWDNRVGAPQSVRGKGLGQRQAFSGGKGLTLRTAARGDQNALSVLDNLSRIYRFKDVEQEFRLKRIQTDRIGFSHVRMNQLHQGLRVVGAELIVHFDKQGDAYEVNGPYVGEIAVDVAPKLAGTDAVRIAQADLKELGQPEGEVREGPELVVFALKSAPRLAYELTLCYDGTDGPGRWRYWVDAGDGTILLRYNDIQFISSPTANGAPATITGNILAGEGGQSLSVTGWYENTGYYYLRNTNRFWYVYNIASSGWSDTNTYAYRSTAGWGASDQAEMSAAWNFDLVQKYFHDIHGRQSFDDGNGWARANVHTPGSVLNGTYNNAWWDGTDFHFTDGDGTTANPLAVLDICGHEFTHAVTEFSAHLIYADESGALNESFSDIFGACIEFYTQPDGRTNYPDRVAGTADWLIGEDYRLFRIALRDLRNPTNSAIVYKQPSRYQGLFWYYPSGLPSDRNDYNGVHNNGGPQNFMFYLLCEGGSGTNDGIGYSVAGIGITNAEQVAYRALTAYCTPSTDYADVRGAWVSAAMDLNADWVTSVSAAWAAVGISAPSFSVRSEDGLVSSGYEGGPFSPTNQIYTLANLDSLPLDWTGSCPSNWVSVTPSNGTLAAWTTTNVSVSFNTNANNLGVGTNASTIVFSNVTSGISQSQSVQLVVRPRVLDHFDWGTIAAAQCVGQAFPVRIHASDATDSLLATFTNRVGLSGWVGRMEPNIVIGSGSYNWVCPMYTSFDDCRTQVIFPTNELGAACNIESLALNVTAVPSKSMNKWTIRMKHTSLASYGASPVWETDWTTVYQTNEPIGTTGWRTFVFSTPFSYNGTNNLLIDFSFNNSSHGTYYGTCQRTAGSQSRTIYFPTSSNFGDPLGWPTNGYNPNPIVSSDIPNLRLGVSSRAINITPTNSGDFISGVWTGSVTVLEAASNMYLHADDGNGHSDESVMFTVLAGSPDDLDNDGIPNWWEQMYFGSVTGANPNAICANGFNTVRQAYIAGLNPNDPQSALRVLSPSSGKVLGWNVVSGRLYNVYWSTNLMNGFQCLESNIPWTRTSFTNPATVPCGYYKIDVRLE